MSHQIIFLYDWLIHATHSSTQAFQRFDSTNYVKLGRLPFTKQHIDSSGFPFRFNSSEPGHRRKKSHLNTGCFFWNKHSLQRFIIRQAQRAAVERFFVGIIKFKPASPVFSSSNTIDNHFETNILCLWFPFDALDITRM
jgi:hypothetical protein